MMANEEAGAMQELAMLVARANQLLAARLGKPFDAPAIRNYIEVMRVLNGHLEKAQ